MEFFRSLPGFTDSLVFRMFLSFAFGMLVLEKTLLTRGICAKDGERLCILSLLLLKFLGKYIMT